MAKDKYLELLLSDDCFEEVSPELLLGKKFIDVMRINIRNQKELYGLNNPLEDLHAFVLRDKLSANEDIFRQPHVKVNLDDDIVLLYDTVSHFIYSNSNTLFRQESLRHYNTRPPISGHPLFKSI